MFTSRFFPGRYFPRRYFPAIGSAIATLFRRIAVEETFAWQRPILSVLSAPPGSPTKGDRYVVGAGASGDWAGHEDDIAWHYNVDWRFDTPGDGWTVFNRDTLGVDVFIDGAWTPTVGIRRAVVVLSDDDLKALPTTPFELVPAAAAGYRNKLIGATMLVNNGGASYTNISAYSYLAIVESTGGWLANGPLNTSGLVGAATLDQMSTFFGGSPGQRLFDFPVAMFDGHVYDSSDYVELVGGLKGVGTPSVQLIGENDGGGDFTGGDPANYARVTVYYAVEQTL